MSALMHNVRFTDRKQRTSVLRVFLRLLYTVYRKQESSYAYMQL